MRTAVPPRPTSYDFRQAGGLAADQVRELTDHLNNLCRALSRTVPESTGLAAQFSVYDVQAATYDGYLNELPENPILALCELGPAFPPLVWQLDAAIAFVLMDTMLGGRGTQPHVREGELTTLERSLVTAIVSGFLATWTQVWPSLGAAEPRVSEVRQTSGRLGTESLEQALMRSSIACVVGESTGIMRIGVPSLGVRPLLREANAKLFPRVNPATVTRDDVARIGHTNLPVAVHLGHGLMTLEEARALRLGDVVILDRGAQDPVDIAVGGVKVFRGISGISNGRLAVRITATAKA